MTTEITIGQREFDALSRLAQAEARIQTQIGGVEAHTAYGSVVDSVLNRVATPGRYGDSIIDAIEFPNAYSAVPNDDWTRLPEATIDVKHRVAEYLAGRMLGAQNVIGDRNLYYNPDIVEPEWADYLVEDSILVIGGNRQSHVFGIAFDEDRVLRAVTGTYSLSISRALAEFFPDGTHVILGVVRYYLPNGTMVETLVGLTATGEIIRPQPGPRDECFLAGTPVTMADGSTKPIERVREGDWVMSFDERTGETKPGRVKRTMQNRAKIVLDFHGTFVTPGHVYWCAGGTFEGRFAPLIDILRDDGVIQHADGTLIRAATGCVVGSPDDDQFWAFLTREEGDADRIIDKRQLRFGTRWMLPDGRHFTMREYMAGIGIVPQPDGSMHFTREGITAPFVWVLSDALPNPEDFVLARSRTTLADIWRAGEWEGMQPAMPAPLVRDGGPVQALSATRLAGMKRNVPMAMAGGAASSMLLPERSTNRRQRKADEARQRQEEKRRSRQFH